MKIYFSCTTTEFKKYEKYYYAIRDFIVEDGHLLTRDWIQMKREVFKNINEYVNKRDIHGTKEIYEKVVKALYSAEALIIEDTVPAFSSGHLITLALKREMPVLVLNLKNEKKTTFLKGFIHGIESDYLQISEYTLDNYKDIIRNFVNKYEEFYKRHRFHLVIDEVEKKYLDWAGFNYGKSKTKIIRNSIRKVLEEDNDYQKYLTEKNS